MNAPRRPSGVPDAGWFAQEGDDARWYWDGHAWTEQRDTPFSVFLSYAHDDGATARTLGLDIERLQLPIWSDDRLYGGQQWWDLVLERIESCWVVVQALSDSSLASEYCTRELRWARALGITVLPVQVGPVTDLPTHEVGGVQLVDYRERGVDQVIRLAAALTGARGSRRRPPHPPPDRPEMPYANLARIRAALWSERELPHPEQREILGQLRAQHRTTSVPSIQNAVATLLNRMSERDDTAADVVQEADELRDRIEASRTLPADSTR